MRILNGGTGATTRVLIESRDGKGNRWFTVGVSPNIVDASFQALSDSIIFKLLREGVRLSATSAGDVMRRHAPAHALHVERFIVQRTSAGLNR